ncbi:polysaccharide deacetylase family protein [Halorussus halophilus]|uniref:polysaccharide deacetylase family protein n=1 Tax=Halorussus halophilus TaxID=2650975 RepID=UPI0013013BBE|nr:polysaccharide deacetylase family protein [Halorussus halophilus]
MSSVEPHRFADAPSTRTACITLDLENNWTFGGELEYLVFEHLDEFVGLVRRLDVPLSVFVVGKVLEDRPDVVRRLDAELDVEFHLHSYQHDMTGNVDIGRELRAGTRAFESVLGRDPAGYRAPRFILDKGDLATLSAMEFEFDSSVCPSYRPGVYNNLDAPHRPYYPAEAPDLLEIPVSVHPRLRVPMEQSYLRLFGDPYLKLLEHSRLPKTLVYNCHLHDFFHTAAHERLGRLKRLAFTRNIENSVAVFERFVSLLTEKGYRFRTLSELADDVRLREDERVVAGLS